MEQDKQLQDLMNKVDAYKTICEDLFIENKALKERINEYEGNSYVV